MSSEVAQIVYNGQPLEIPSGSTVADVLARQQVRTELVAVEVNLEIVPKPQHTQVVLGDGDQIEVVTLVGGG
ncbi:MAG: sulfur carrier protein ThiS [Aureliella sp.]|jgi:sulfur carrier protein